MLDWRRGGFNLQWVYVNCAIYICYIFGVLVFQRSILDWKRGDEVNLPWVYVHCAISAKCGVVLFKASMFDWRRRMGSICHGYMCILLDMKLIWCSGFPEIYACLEGVGSVCHDDFSICALHYICNCFGVVGLHRSIVNWRRGGQLPCQLTIDASYTITPQSVSHIAQCTYTHDRCTPTPQSTIDPCYTVTPHKSHILVLAHIPMTD